MQNKYIMPLIGTILLCLNVGWAQDTMWTSNRPDGHAPISVMGDHVHQKGELMFSYRFMTMGMSGMYNENTMISNQDVLSNYIITPLDMRMRMHMVGMMYAPSDKLTLIGMVNYNTNTMDLITRTDVQFTTQSKGLGDIKLALLYQLFNKKHQSLHANIGISIPTGSIDARGVTPMNDNAQLAYPMQLGSGTWDPDFGLTYLIQANTLSGGTQLLYQARLGKNSESYSFGNKFNATAWGAVRLMKTVSFSLSISYQNITPIKGSDNDINPLMMPLFDTNNSGRSQLDAGIGANYNFHNDLLKGLRLAAEYKLPVYQYTTGIQMQNASRITIGLQYAINNHH